MSNAEPTHPPAQKHRTDVGNNIPLVWLYALAIIGLGLGVVISAISTYQADVSYDPTGALLWQGIGVQLMNGGTIFLVGGMVAHAINWQVGRSGQRR